MTSKRSASRAWFSFREGVIIASVVPEISPKLNSKHLFHKNKASINLCAKICSYQKSQKRVNPFSGVYPKKILHEKDMLGKINRHTSIFSSRVRINIFS